MKKRAKKKIRAGILATIGYILSPFSWYNDIIINIPLAYAFAFPFGLISEKLFLPTMILGYWITNIAGFVLMHHGIHEVLSKKEHKYSRDDLIKDFIISILYTLVVIIIIKSGWLKFPLEYFR